MVAVRPLTASDGPARAAWGSPAAPLGHEPVSAFSGPTVVGLHSLPGRMQVWMKS